ncbi:MAG: hypothetical protein OXC48_12395 [Endozoicomonadaceae bacterium]|nr:hypothetical protein [Endozoicomonadaceae bacterium]
MLYPYRLFYLSTIFFILYFTISNAAPPDNIRIYQIKKASNNVVQIAPDFPKNFVFCPQGVNTVELLSAALPRPVFPALKTPDFLKEGFEQCVFEDNDDEVLKSANFIFSQKVLQSNEKDLLTKRGNPHIFDDPNSYPEAVRKANEIISELTNAALKDIIREKDDFIFIAANVVYFKAKWGVRCKKAPALTWKKDKDALRKVDGFKINLDNGRVKTGNTDGYDVYSIPINKRESAYKFIIAIPEENSEKKPEQAILDSDIAFNCIEVSKFSRLDQGSITIPDFHIKQTHKLNSIFASSANPFEASQEVFIKVNEEGVEASAHTDMVISMGVRFGKEIKIDKPFAFWVINETSGKVLFTGTVYDP